MRHLLPILCLVAVLACGCSSPMKAIDGCDSVHTQKAFDAAPGDFRFAIMADRTGGMRPGVFEDAIEKLNLLQPEFVMCVGDLIGGYTEEKDKAKLEQMHTEIDALVGRLEMPFFYLPGNHDISNPFMAKDYIDHYQRSYYHFLYKNVLFLCLNTEDPPDTHIGPEQASYAARVLKENPNARWTFVFMHKPMWISGRDKGWEPIEKLLEGRPHTVFAGHLHGYSKSQRSGRDYYVLATTGGDSRLLGPMAGSFDHIMWVTVNQKGPHVVNLVLAGIAPEMIRPEKPAEAQPVAAPK